MRESVVEYNIRVMEDPGLDKLLFISGVEIWSLGVWFFCFSGGTLKIHLLSFPSDKLILHIEQAWGFIKDWPANNYARLSALPAKFLTLTK